MKKRLLALLLALAMGLSLAACSAPAAEDPSESPSQSAEPTTSTEPAIEVDLTQDILTFAAGDLAKETGLVTVNGQSVPTSRLLYWVAYSCSYFESMYYYYGMTVADYADYILADACTMGAYYAILEQKVAEYGCPLTDEQLEAINTEMDLGGPDHEQRKVLYGLTEDDLMFIYSIGDYYENLMSILVSAPTEEDLAAYVDEVGYYQSRHILIATAGSSADGVVTLTTGETVEYAGTVEEYNAEAQAKAQDILAQLQAAEDLETLFVQLMNEHSQDGRDAEGNLAAPEGYTSTPGQMVTEYETAALALEPGQISDLVQSTYGYHIILRDELPDLNGYAEEYCTAKMDALIEEWLAAADTQQGEALAELDVAAFYERYVAWQQAYLEANPTEE